MTSVGAVNSYSNYATNSSTGSRNAAAAGSAGKAAAASGSSTSSATNVTLSPEAQAALSTKSFLEVMEEARESLTTLIEDAGTDGPYKEDGKLAIDLSSFDRRSLWAIASNTDGTFTDDEIKAAGAEMTGRFDDAMVGPFAVYKVTGNVTKLYQAAKTWLDGASAEEKASTGWKTQSAAVDEALGKLETSPTTWPIVDDDPVTDYISRSASGQTGTEQDFSSLADNARAALDLQIAAAAAQGKSLNFSQYQKSGIKADFSDFSSRALSSIVLNKGDQFSAEEVNGARQEISSRGRQVLMSCITDASRTSSPTAMAENIISAYSSLSSEERQAVGWDDSLYQAAVANYKSASYIASMFNNSGTSSLLGAMSSASSPTSGFSSLASLLSSS